MLSRLGNVDMDAHRSIQTAFPPISMPISQYPTHFHPFIEHHLALEDLGAHIHVLIKPALPNVTTPIHTGVPEFRGSSVPEALHDDDVRKLGVEVEMGLQAGHGAALAQEVAVDVEDAQADRRGSRALELRGESAAGLELHEYRAEVTADAAADLERWRSGAGRLEVGGNSLGDREECEDGGTLHSWLLLGVWRGHLGDEC